MARAGSQGRAASRSGSTRRASRASPTHFDRYVEDRRLRRVAGDRLARRRARPGPGVAGTATARATLAGDRRHALAHLLDDQAGHGRRAMMPLRGGPLRPQRQRRALDRGAAPSRASTSARHRGRPRRVRADGPGARRHLLSHTAGLTYGFQYRHPVDEMYRDKGYDFGGRPDADLARAVHDLCSSPLLFEPGTRWNYSVAHGRARAPRWRSGAARALDVFFARAHPRARSA